MPQLGNWNQWLPLKLNSLLEYHLHPYSDLSLVFGQSTICFCFVQEEYQLAAATSSVAVTE